MSESQLDSPEEADSFERSLKRGGRLFAFVELALGLGACALAVLLWKGAVSWGALSKHSIWFAGGAGVLGLVFFVGGLRGLMARKT